MQTPLSKVRTFFWRLRADFTSGWKKGKPTTASPFPSSHLWTAFSARSRHLAQLHLRLSQTWSIRWYLAATALCTRFVRAVENSTQSQMVMFCKSSSLIWRVQTNKVDRVRREECSSLWWMFQICCARSALSSPLFSQTMDPDVVEAARV